MPDEGSHISYGDGGQGEFPFATEGKTDGGTERGPTLALSEQSGGFFVYSSHKSSEGITGRLKESPVLSSGSIGGAGGVGEPSSKLSGARTITRDFGVI